MPETWKEIKARMKAQPKATRRDLVIEHTEETNPEGLLALLSELPLEPLLAIQNQLPTIIEQKRELSRDRRLEQAILYLAGRCDGAMTKDGAGFNGADTGFGHWLAERIEAKQPLILAHAQAALKMLGKYKGQLEQSGLTLPDWEAIAHQYPASVTLPSPEEKKPDKRIEIVGEEVAVFAPYDESGKFQKSAKSINCYRFNNSDKSWRYPLEKSGEVVAAFPDCVPDENVKVAITHIQAKKAEEEAAKQQEAQEKAAEIVQLLNAAELDKPLPSGRSLFAHQKEAVQWLLYHQRGSIHQGGILADHMGLGKTCGALVAAKAMKKVHNVPVFVICPASLRDNWLREAEGVGVGIEVFSWAKLPKPLETSKYVLIADECFLYHTPILTNLGWLPIGQIVEYSLPVFVFSLNIECNALMWKPVSRWISHTRQTRLVFVRHSKGEFICTENHKIWTEEHGYVMAGTLESGTSLRVLPEYFSHNLEREKHCQVLQSPVRYQSLCAVGWTEAIGIETPTASSEELRMVRSNVFNAAEQNSQRGKALLQQDLRQYTQGESAARKRATPADNPTCDQIQNWAKLSCLVGANESQQSDERSKNQTQSQSVDVWSNVSSSWRELQNYRAAVNASNGVRTGRLYGIFNSDQTSERAVSISATLLQSGYSRPHQENSYRSGRKEPQGEKTALFGQAENSGTECAWVVSVEVLEPGDIERFGISNAASETVYNLEVADNHNYFADGVLVSNCHYAQSLKSQRTQAMLELADSSNCLAAWLLTGTPIKNGRPINLYPLLLACKHPIALDQRKYELHFCAAGYKDVGKKTVWDNTGAAHLDELAKKTEDVILRRTKKECLDLPPKIRQLKPAELSKEAESIYSAKLAELKKTYRERVKAKLISNAAEALVILGQLRLAGSIAKVEAAIALAEELLEQGEPVVIFTEFTESAITIHKHLGGELLTGDTPTSERQAIVDRFQAGESKVFIGTIKAGGVGLTLTAASHVILVDRPWSPGDAEQAEDRLHRIGQGQTVNAIWLQHGRIDETVDALLESKQERIELVLKGKRKTLRGLAEPAELAQELLKIMLLE